MFYVINSALSRQWIVVVIVQGVLMMFLDFPFVLSVGYTLRLPGIWAASATPVTPSVVCLNLAFHVKTAIDPLTVFK